MEANLVSWRQITQYFLFLISDLTEAHLAKSLRPLTFHDKNLYILFLAIGKQINIPQTLRSERRNYILAVGPTKEEAPSPGAEIIPQAALIIFISATVSGERKFVLGEETARGRRQPKVQQAG